MIYIEYVPETDTKGLVNFIHYKPLDDIDGLGKTEEELSMTGVLVVSLPELEQREGHTAKLYINPQTKELWYEYLEVPKPETPEQKIQRLEQNITAMQEAINFILLGL